MNSELKRHILDIVREKYDRVEVISINSIKEEIEHYRKTLSKDVIPKCLLIDSSDEEYQELIQEALFKLFPTKEIPLHRKEYNYDNNLAKTWNLVVKAQ